MSVDRIATALIIVFGLVFLFWIIPAQIETVDYGRIIPSTVPTIAMWAIVIVALVQLFTDTSKTTLNTLVCVRAAGFVFVLIGSVFLMDRFGFEYFAPLLALVIMVAIGERRWYWLVFGGVVLPLGIWFLVENVLDRALA